MSLALTVPSAAFAALASCSPGDYRSGACTPSVGIGSGGVDLGVNITDPGTRPGTGGSGSANGNGAGAGGSAGSGSGSGTGTGAGAPVGPPAPCGLVCQNPYTITAPADAVPGEGRGPITLADLVNFQPVVGVPRMEPNGWAVVGLHTNFWVDAGPQVQEGLLIGLPASVRFTPVAYRWSYGDGTTAVVSEPGSSWAAAGLPEFSPTPTSHVYSGSGQVTATLTVDFSAEYTFGQTDWIAIAGSVPVPSAPMAATVQRADTVLVGGDCSSARAGLGC
ncbi:hypothetical protein [Marisediminicola senii]|uniref:hypothetical protein n=1 Tax=Marisediminicola senii TaxID=2711233 RepID=UPI0013ED7D9B|nr:hypothetical protein [Marisediminicola senii]